MTQGPQSRYGWLGYYFREEQDMWVAETFGIAIAPFAIALVAFVFVYLKEEFYKFPFYDRYDD